MALMIGNLSVVSSTAVGWAHPGMTTVARIRVAGHKSGGAKGNAGKSAAGNSAGGSRSPNSPTGPIRCALTSPAEPCRAPVDAAIAHCAFTNVASNKRRVQQRSRSANMRENTLMTSTTRPSLLAIAGATASAAVLAAATPCAGNASRTVTAQPLATPWEARVE